MSFQTRYRTFAVSPENVEALLGGLLAAYGEEFPDGAVAIRTIGAHWDDTEQTRQRAARFPETEPGIPLTDGRLAFRVMWQADLAAEFDAHGMAGVEELSEERLEALKVVDGEELP